MNYLNFDVPPLAEKTEFEVTTTKIIMETYIATISTKISKEAAMAGNLDPDKSIL